MTELLEQHFSPLRNPIDDSDWLDVRGRTRRPVRRIAIAAAVVVAIAAIAAPTLAFSDGVRSFLGLQRQPVFEKAQLLVSAPVGDGGVAHLWSSPSRHGGECIFLSYDLPGKIERPSRITGGGSCSLTPGPQPRKSGLLGGSVSRYRDFQVGSGSVGPVLYGYLDSSLGVKRVEIRWTGGSKELGFANDYFLGVVEPLRDAGPEKLPVRVIAYGGEGQVVRQIKVNPAWLRTG